MNYQSFIFTFLLPTPFVLSQEKPLAESVASAEVLDEVVLREGKDTLVIQRIEQPDFSDDQIRKATRTSEMHSPKADEPNNILPPQTFFVSAGKAEDSETQFEIWSTQRGQASALRGWSNIDWSVLQSHLTVVDGDQTFQYILFYTPRSGEGDAAGAVADLPTYEAEGARFAITSAEVGHQVTLDFLEALHALYESNLPELKERRRLNLHNRKQRLRQLEVDRAAPKSRTLKIWRHTIEKDS